MAPQPPPDRDETQLLLDRLDLLRTPRPFRKQIWKPSARRNKNLKQILSESSRREAASIAATQNNSGASTPFQAAASSNATSAAAAATDDGGAQTPASGAVGKQANIAQAAQNLSTLVLEKNYSKSMTGAGASAATGPAVTYTNIESAPSLHPGNRKHYCDITGLPAPYTDPKTRLRYHNREVFGVVRSLGQGVAENYLAARGAQIVLK